MAWYTHAPFGYPNCKRQLQQHLCKKIVGNTVCACGSDDEPPRATPNYTCLAITQPVFDRLSQFHQSSSVQHHGSRLYVSMHGKGAPIALSKDKGASVNKGRQPTSAPFNVKVKGHLEVVRQNVVKGGDEYGSKHVLGVY